MAQAGEGKLNYRCPSCFMRDLDIGMFYGADKKEYYCLRGCYKAQNRKCGKKMKWRVTAAGLCWNGFIIL